MPSRRAPAKRQVGVAELEALPDDGCRYELVHGRLVREPPAGYEHSWVGVRIARCLAEFADRERLGYVAGADAGFVLFNDPPTVRAPDASFVAAARFPEGLPTGFARLAPDLAVEVVSPSDRLEDTLEKVFDYLNAGSRQVWLVQPRARTITVYRSRTDVRVLVEGDVLDGGDVLPGFALDVRDLFAR